MLSFNGGGDVGMADEGDDTSSDTDTEEVREDALSSKTNRRRKSPRLNGSNSTNGGMGSNYEVSYGCPFIYSIAFSILIIYYTYTHPWCMFRAMRMYLLIIRLYLLLVKKRQ